MPYVYSLGQKCATEGLGMMLVIYFGESILANELLAKTKGHSMGWVWVALGFGMSFGIPIAIFNFASAKLNPAMLLANWVYLGKLNGLEFLALTACECLGGFVGAILVWLHYLPFFKTIPEAPPKTSRQGLLRPRDYIGVGGLRIAGYNTQRHNEDPREKLKGFLGDAGYYLQRDYFRPVEMQVLRENELQTPGGLTRRRSVQVADLHRMLNRVDVLDQVAQKSAKSATGASQPVRKRPTGGSLGGSPPDAGGSDGIPRRSNSATPLVPANQPDLAQTSKEDAIYQAAKIADQNAKLSIFATRPAIYTPVFNFLTEFMAATMLIGGALLVDERGEMLYQSAKSIWPPINGLYIGFFVFVFVLAFGGPTGVGVNIARDTAPRFAHFILPIPNKGPSEWYYAWIPALASLMGGLAGGGLFDLFNKLNRSNVEAPDIIIGV